MCIKLICIYVSTSSGGVEEGHGLELELLDALELLTASERGKASEIRPKT